MTDFKTLANNSSFFNKPSKSVDINLSKSLVKLNIASGPNVFAFDGWINYDRADLTGYFNHICGIAKEMAQSSNGQYSENILHNLKQMPDQQRKVVEYLMKGGVVDYKVQDLRNGFVQHPDNSVDIIYLGQMIEHLNPVYEVPKLLKECYRMLKPGGVLRIATPDLDLLIKAYLNNEMDKFAAEQPEFYKTAHPSSQLAYLMYGSGGPSCTWDNYEGHMFLFTKASMTSALEAAHFKGPFFFYYESNKSVSETIVKEVFDAGMSHSFITEAVK